MILLALLAVLLVLIFLVRGLLILVLLLSLILLILLLLLLLLFLQFLEFAFHEVAVVPGIGVGGFELQRGFVGLDGLFPGLDGFLGVGLFRLLAQTILRVAEIVIIILLERQVIGLHCLGKRLGGLVESARFVGGGPVIELQHGSVRMLHDGLAILLLSAGVIPLLKGPFRRADRGVHRMGSGHQRDGEGGRRPGHAIPRSGQGGTRHGDGLLHASGGGCR